MPRRRTSVCLALAVTTAMLAYMGLLLFGGAALPAAASVIQQAGATPMAAPGTVTTANLSVLAQPELTGRVVGQLWSGSQVNILGQRGSWYQIEYARGPRGKGWVSARFVQVENGNAHAGSDAEAGARPGAGTASTGGTGEVRMPAPMVIAYQAPVLRWKWAGDTAALGDKDWYFDVQVIRKFEPHAYWTLAAEPPGKPKGAMRRGDTYSVNIPASNFRCDSSFGVQIAVRENGRLTGWISPRSNLLLFTRVCQPKPTPEPPPSATTDWGSQEIERTNPEGPVYVESTQEPPPDEEPTQEPPPVEGLANPEGPVYYSPPNDGSQDEGQVTPEPTPAPPALIEEPAAAPAVMPPESTEAPVP